MEIISVVPRGYCQGVVRAIQIARKTAQDNPDTPVYMLGMIVHNQFVVDACKAIGIRFVEEAGKTRSELLDRINSINCQSRYCRTNNISSIIRIISMSLCRKANILSGMILINNY